MEYESHRLYYGRVADPKDGSTVDEVLMAVMRAPHSYTREDVVEFQAHGGSVAIGSILELVLRSGARLAEAGEFTRRAFLNGRIDLSQAEAVIDVIEARTASARKTASLQLDGALRTTVEALRAAMSDVQVRIEAGIDFPDDVGELFTAAALAEEIEDNILHRIEALIAGAEHGRLFRDGLRLGIVGLPNVGKSSLMNRLIEQDRVIVTDIPGTTRDAVEESLDIQGIPVTIIDTAGLQDTDDPVERIGVQKSVQMIKGADMVLFVVDGSRPPVVKEREWFEQMPRGRTLLVINKADKIANAPGYPCPEKWAGAPAVVISALYNRGIGALKEQVAAIALGKAADRVEFGILPNLRHKLFLEAAAEAVGRGVKALRADEPLELVALSIKEGLSNLGSILGLEVAEDVLDHIFNRFCIGK